jgi:hypothetical protein
MKRRLGDRITFQRFTTLQDEFGDNTVTTTTTVGTYWCHLKYLSGAISQSESLENQIITDYELYFRKKSVQAILKGDIGTLETGSVKVKINSIVEHDDQTIKMTASSVS